MPGKQPHDFHRDQNGFDKNRHARRPENVLPVILRSVDRADDERKKRQHTGHGQVRRGGPQVGHQAKQVAEQDKEESRQQVGQKTIGLLADVGSGDLIPHEYNEHFGQILQHAPGSRGAADAFAIALRHRNKQGQHQQGGDQAEHVVARDGQIQHQLTLARMQLGVEVMMRRDQFLQFGGRFVTMSFVVSHVATGMESRSRAAEGIQLPGALGCAHQEKPGQLDGHEGLQRDVVAVGCMMNEHFADVLAPFALFGGQQRTRHQSEQRDDGKPQAGPTPPLLNVRTITHAFVAKPFDASSRFPESIPE